MVSVKGFMAVFFAGLLWFAVATAPEAQGRQANPLLADPLTHAELKQVIYEADRAMSIVLRLDTPAQEPGDERPATRAEVLGEFDRLLRRYESQALITPVAPLMNEEILERLPEDEREVARRLIRHRVVAPVGNLLVNSDQGVELAEFGRAVGFFMTGIAEITHLPSREFSPRLSEF